MLVLQENDQNAFRLLNSNYQFVFLCSVFISFELQDFCSLIGDLDPFVLSVDNLCGTASVFLLHLNRVLVSEQSLKEIE